MGKWVSELRIHGESAQEWELGRVLQKSCFHGPQDRVLTEMHKAFAKYLL